MTLARTAQGAIKIKVDGGAPRAVGCGCCGCESCRIKMPSALGDTINTATMFTLNGVAPQVYARNEVGKYVLIFADFEYEEQFFATTIEYFWETKCFSFDCLNADSGEVMVSGVNCCSTASCASTQFSINGQLFDASYDEGASFPFLEMVFS